MTLRLFIVPLFWMLTSLPLHGLTCDITFTVDVTQGVPAFPPGAQLAGRASFSTLGGKVQQEGGTTAHLASGEMIVGERISGPIWTIIVTSKGSAADLVGVYANEVSGLTVAGVEFAGPMMLTLFGRPGTRPEAEPPTSQEDWDKLDLRRTFSIQAPQGRDMLAGDVSDLRVNCR